MNKHGAPMGCPLSPVIANLLIEEFENKAPATATLKPGLDTLTIR